MRFFLAISLLWLAPIADVLAARAQDPAALAATHGYVTVEWPRGSNFALEVEPVAGGRNQALVRRPDLFATDGLWLPPGEYRFASYAGTAWQDDYPTFTVEAGRLTDLGGMLPVDIGGDELVILPLRHPDSAAALAKVEAANATWLSVTEPLRWSTDVPPRPIRLPHTTSGLGLIADLLLMHADNVNRPSVKAQLQAAATVTEFMRLLRTLQSPSRNDPAIGSDGRMVFAAGLGQVRIRAADGTWSNAGLDTLASVLAVELDGDRLLIGTDDGSVHASSDGGATWQLVRQFGQDEDVVDIDHDAGHWVVATASHGLSRMLPFVDRVRVYAGAAADLSDLQAAGDFPLQANKQYGWAGPQGELVQGHYVVVLPPQVQRLDLATRQWQDVSPPKAVTRLRANGDSSVLTALLAKGAMSRIWTSTDAGGTWTQIARPEYVIDDVQMDAADAGWASRMKPGAFKVDWELYTYRAAGKRWELTGTAPFACTPVRVRADQPLLCVTTGGSILRRDGEEWIVEFAAN